MDTIYLQEAKTSSEIENIVTTNDELAANRKIEDSATKEVLNYKQALWHGLEHLEKRPFITTNLCVEIMQHIKQNTSSIRATPGTTLANPHGEIIYTPPAGETIIREKLSKWETFINDDNGIDPLIKMALMHYQFEAIHPFSDGNGRTGRILMLLFLKIKRLLDIPAIYLSNYIIQNKAQYYRLLQNVTERDEWEQYILDMVEVTAKSVLERLKKIMQAMDVMANEMKEKAPKVCSKDFLPYIKRQHLIDADLGNPKTVGKYLTDLEKNGLLKSVKVGKEKLYLNERLLNFLENCH